KAQQLVADLPLADYNRGTILEHMGHFDAAVANYRAAIQRNPLDTPAHHALNMLLHRMGRDDDFLRSYDDAVRYNPNAGHLYLSKGYLLFTAANHEGARECYARAAALLPGNVTPHDGLAMTHARLGDFESAIREHEITVKMEPANAPAWAHFSETM